jgi:hypothetical protein
MADDNGRSKSTAAAAEPEQPTTAEKAKKKGRKKAAKKATGSGRPRGGAGRVKFPKHSILGCIRIPQAILEQNVGVT